MTFSIKPERRQGKLGISSRGADEPADETVEVLTVEGFKAAFKDALPFSLRVINATRVGPSQVAQQ